MSGAWSQLEQLLTCAICLDRFRNPKLLPCQHTFCGEPCMEGLVDYARRQIKCPECRAEHRIPYNGVQSLPNNVTLARFLDLHRGITGEEPEPLPSQMDRCGVCGEKSFCVRCSHCEKKVCEECRSAHLDILRREINRINTQVRRGLSKLSEHAEQSEKSSERLLQISSQIRDEITESVRRLIKDLKDKESKLLADLEEFTISETKNGEKLKVDLDSELQTITSNCELVEEHITETDDWSDAELMEYKDIFLKTLDFLRNLDPDTMDFARKIKYIQKVDLDNLRRTVADFGEIKITQPSALVSSPLSPSESSNNLSLPQSNLMRSQSDHRLAAQFASRSQRNDPLQRSYLDVTGQNRYGSDTERERASSPPGKRYGSVHERSRFGRTENTDFGYTRGWQRPGDSEYEPSNSSNFRSRFMRERIRERGGGDDHSFDDPHDSDVGSGHRVRFQEENSSQPRVKLFDTEEMTNMRAPLSGLIKLIDSPHVMERLHQNEIKAKQKETEEKENPPASTPAVTAPVAPTSTPAPRPTRQISEDEIEKQKKQNKAAAAQQQSSTNASPNNNSQTPQTPKAAPTPKPALDQSTRSTTSPAPVVTNRRVQALQKEDTRSSTRSNSDDNSESGDVTCDEDTSTPASALNSSARRRIFASTHSASGGGNGNLSNSFSHSVDYSDNLARTGQPKQQSTTTSNRPVCTSFRQDISVAEAVNASVASDPSQCQAITRLESQTRPLSPIPSSPTQSHQTSSSSASTTSSASSSPASSPLPPCASLQDQVTGQGAASSDTAVPRDLPSPPLSLSTVENEQPQSNVASITLSSSSARSNFTIPSICVKGPGGIDVEIVNQSPKVTIMRRAPLKQESDESSESEDDEEEEEDEEDENEDGGETQLPQINSNHLNSNGQVTNRDQSSSPMTDSYTEAESESAVCDEDDSLSTSGTDHQQTKDNIKSESNQDNDYGQYPLTNGGGVDIMNNNNEDSEEDDSSESEQDDEESDESDQESSDHQDEEDDSDEEDDEEREDEEIQKHPNETIPIEIPIETDNLISQTIDDWLNVDDEESEDEEEDEDDDDDDEEEEQNQENQKEEEHAEEDDDDEEECEDEMMDAEDGSQTSDEESSESDTQLHTADCKSVDYYQSPYYGYSSKTRNSNVSRYGSEDSSGAAQHHNAPSTYTSKTRRASRDDDADSGVVPSSPSHNSTTSAYFGSAFGRRNSRSSTIDDDTAIPEGDNFVDASSTGHRLYGMYGRRTQANAQPSNERFSSSYLKNRLAKSRSSHTIAYDDSDEESNNNTNSNPLSPAISTSFRSRFGFGSSATSEYGQNADRSSNTPAANNGRRTSRSGYTYRTRDQSPEDDPTAGSVTQYLINKYGSRSSASRPSMLSKSKSSHVIYGRSLSSSDEETPANLPSPFRRSSRDSEFSYKSSSSSYGLTYPRQVYLQKRRMMMKIGSRGTNPGCFTWPRGVACAPDNRIVVADSSNHRIQVFDSTGRFQLEFGSYGSGEGEFDCLAGVTVNRIGHFIVSDRYNHRVQVFDASGRFLRAFGSEGRSDGKFSYPWGISTDALGFIYVCDKENHRIQVFQSDGTFVGKFGSIGSRSGLLEHPHYIAVSNTNRIVVSDSNNHRIQVFDINGRSLSTFGTEGSNEGQFKFPRGVAVDENGFIIVGDSGNNRIQIFNPDGTFLKSFGQWGSGDGEFKGLEGVAISSTGNILVCDRENHRIQIF